MTDGAARFQDGFLPLADGPRMHFRDYPGDPGRLPVLCLHGLTRNARDFESLAEHLSPTFRVIVPEFRGRGESDPDPQPLRYTPVTYAGDVVALLDHLGIAQAIFVGTSLGGLVTMIVAARAPGRIAATVLNDIGPELTAEGLDRIQGYLGKDVRFRSWDAAADAIAASQGSAFPGRTRDEWVAMARRNCREGDDGEIRFDYDMAIAEPFRVAGPVPKFDMWPLFKLLAATPLLVIRGEISDLLSQPAADAMQQAAPDATFVTVPGVGHAPELDEPAARAAIDRFLQQVAAAG